MTKKVAELLGVMATLSADEMAEFNDYRLKSDKVLVELTKVAKAFSHSEDERVAFVRRYYEQAWDLIARAEAMGYNYELVLVPGRQRLRALIDMFDRVYGYIPHHATAVWFDEQPWSEVREMRDKDNFGIPEEDQLSALLLNPWGYGDTDGHHSRKGLFFTGMTLTEQIMAVDELVSERAGVRPLSIAEYLCVNIVRAANKDMLLDKRVSTRFVQYGLVDITDKYGRPIGLFAPIAYLDHGGRVSFSYSIGGGDSHRGVRLSVGTK